jgi:hypothetical protein
MMEAAGTSETATNFYQTACAGSNAEMIADLNISSEIQAKQCGTVLKFSLSFHFVNDNW